LRYETDWWSPAPLSKLGVPLVVKLRVWFRFEEVRLGRRGAEDEPPCEAARRDARPGPGVRTADEGGESMGDVKPGLEAWLVESGLSLGGWGKEPTLMVFRKGLLGGPEGVVAPILGRLEVELLGMLPREGRDGRPRETEEGDLEGCGRAVTEALPAAGVVVTEDLRVFATGREGSGAEGGNEGRGRVVVAMAREGKSLASCHVS
jgi:hypothetical protein